MYDMSKYIHLCGASDIPDGAIDVPPEAIDPKSIVLADAERDRLNKLTRKTDAVARIMAIYADFDEGDTDWTGPGLHPEVGMSRVGRVLSRIRHGIDRWLLWNVSYPLKMWFHFHFQREKPLPSGTPALRAMLREAFAAEGVTDVSLPYPAEPVSPFYACGMTPGPMFPHADDGPSRWDLFFNRKRPNGS